MASSSNLIKVKTTLPQLPFLPNADRKPIQTERLIIRALAQDDLHALHQLRTQPEVMIFTRTGRIDGDLSETQARLDKFLPPTGDIETYNMAVCLAATGEMVGIGGVHNPGACSDEFGWPEIGYQFNREHWGRGYATEFMRAFLESWWAIPRAEAEIEVDLHTVPAGYLLENGGRVPEMLVAVVDAVNMGSSRILQKTGFECYREWKEPDSRAGFEGQDVALVEYAFSSKGMKLDVQ
ncbi:hypothetical protein PG999_001088 [Apiospora kogelbergensis]|uniref:N-acetyltransferase domain-containing protein n=1 Tax=Apiospora kogelbergensis TaxID=1337665 RepID=A0AAW0RDB9_9PEZI